ncbi:MAG: hypothetical protein ACI83P_001562 [Janthinobacterium sp.]|jgi:hypothetical protein
MRKKDKLSYYKILLLLRNDKNNNFFPACRQVRVAAFPGGAHAGCPMMRVGADTDRRCRDNVRLHLVSKIVTARQTASADLLPDSDGSTPGSGKERVARRCAIGAAGRSGVGASGGDQRHVGNRVIDCGA